MTRSEPLHARPARSNRERVALHESWWRRENDRPLVDNFVPLDLPFKGLDINVPVGQIGERKSTNARVMAEAAQDLLVVQRVDFGPALIPALAGAGFMHDAHTSWNTPVAEHCRDLKVRPFDPRHPLWIAYTQRREELLRHWSWDTFLPGHLNNVGPFDILAALLGPENLILEMTDDPEGVKALSLQAAELLADVMHADIRALREHGPSEGTTDVFGFWLPGNGTRFVEDFTALIGPEYVREFVLPASRRAVHGFDSVLYHTHSAAWRNLPTMVDLQCRLAVEFGTDPGEPGLQTRIDTTRRLQQLGLPVQYGSWNHVLTQDEIRHVVSSLQPRGLALRFQFRDRADSEATFSRITKATYTHIKDATI